MIAVGLSRLNYYPHHIGDFNHATRHLTRVERALYRELIELYYDTERPLNACDFPSLCKRVLANSEEEQTAVAAILKEFFERDGDVWRHRRCDQELASYRAKQAAASRAGKASAERRLNGCSTAVEPPLDVGATNQNQNQEPKERAGRATRLPASWALPAEWQLLALKEQPTWTPAYCQRVALSFRNYWVAKAGRDGAKLDWRATWHNWVMKEGPLAGSQRGKLVV